MIIAGALFAIAGGFMATQNTSSRLAFPIAAFGAVLIIIGIFK